MRTDCIGLVLGLSGTQVRLKALQARYSPDAVASTLIAYKLLKLPLRCRSRYKK